MDGVMDGWMVAHSMDSPNAQDSLSREFDEFKFFVGRGLPPHGPPGPPKVEKLDIYLILP